MSSDPQETNDRFRAELGLPYPLVGDPHGTLCRVYRVRWPLLGRAQRVTYLIGRDHHVRLAFHDEFRMDAHAEKICATLAAEAGA